MNATTELLWLDLGESGRSWVHASLQQGRALSQAVLRITKLELTQTWAYVPTSRKTEIATDPAVLLASGGVFSPS